MSKQRIVVVGAGFAGLSATRLLSSKLKQNAEITLIDKHSYHTMMTQLHEVAAGRVEEEAGQYDLQKLLGRRKNVQLVTDTVTNVDKENKVVVTENGRYEYDFVLLALGGEPNDFGVPGVAEHGFTLWSMEDALRIRRHLEVIIEKAVIEHDEEKRRAMLTFAVAGSGFTGIEMLGELIDWKEIMAKKYHIDPSEITLAVVEMMPTILNTLPRPDADKALRFLHKKGVKVLTNHAITEVAENHIKVKDGADIPTYTLIWTTGVQGNTQAKAYGLKETERGNRLVANEYMEAVGFEGKGVYVAGDISGVLDEQGRPQPQIVEAAEQTGHTAASNIIAEINGGEKHKFVGKYQGTLVSIGSKWGVAYLMNFLHLSGFWAMLMKHLVYMLYCFQIRSGYYLFQYLKNEFFHTTNMRNMGYGHLSRMGNVLWSVPLRIFYGLTWLVEASHKIVGEGDFLKPYTWFGKGSWFTNDVHFTFPWLQENVTTGASEAASDAVSAASGAAASGAGEAAKSVFGLSYSYGNEPMAVFDSVPKFLEPVMKFMIPNKETALLMQKVMSFVEVAIALALILGLFTFIASGATAGLTVMFCLSGMFYWTNIWFVFVAIALMNGSGRAFGLDRYVQPWIQKHLSKWWYGVSRPLYKKN
ncbi:NADH dehydrogenase [Pilibacter termitis]|uniref:NADH:ubiquinone reductase (non-electrogenic) n=1 Tax=Pilibacter termitis TaxID=263852 RepID=A0A1T4N0X7_9ENTE|nr:NAD(P)/FAD-dependent oxidoreductase [Pilibacter termitis]SJZ72687.1 NADH dehydrogenase [Pilibacter termitis]